MPPNQSEMFILLTKVSEDVTEVKTKVATIEANQMTQDTQILKMAEQLDTLDIKHEVTRDRQDEFRRHHTPGSKTDVVMVGWAKKMFLLSMIGLLTTIVIAVGTVVWQHKNPKVATASPTTSPTPTPVKTP